ncbi:MAG: hypothetical protein AAGE93_17425 [Bacteroidota bacterium]
MNIEEYQASLQDSAVPPHIDTPLQALWYAAKDNWDKAHALVQDEDDANSAWVHAYLHRVEGDSFNAQYWYNRANRPMPDEPLAKEWIMIVSTLVD